MEQKNMENNIHNLDHDMMIDSHVVMEVNESYPDGCKYIGQKKEGKKEGTGSYRFNDGSHYEGEWRNDKMEGRGCLYYPNKQKAY